MRLFIFAIMFAAGLAGVHSLPALAAKNARLVAPKFGLLLYHERFKDSQLDQAWFTSGTWIVNDGVIRGENISDDQRAGALILKQPNRNSSVKFSFQFDGAQSLRLGFDHAHGPLFCIEIHPQSITIQKASLQQSAETSDDQQPTEQRTSVALTNFATHFEPGKWYTAQIDVDGDKVYVRTDNGVIATAQDPGIDTEKVGYRFAIQGNGILLDDIQVWDDRRP